MAENTNTQTKEELIENISELFLKYGLRSTSMEDICNHLKISKKTLYQFFTNKDDIVEQVMFYRRKGQRAQNILEELRKLNSIELLLEMKKYIIDDFNSRLPANLFDIKKYHPEVYEKIIEDNNIFIHSLMKETLERGIHDNLFRENINLDVQIYLFIKQMTFLGEPEIISEIKYSIEVIITTIINNFIRSLSTMKGLEILEKIIHNSE